MMARAYHTSYKMPVIVTRGNNVYGPHQVRQLAVWLPRVHSSPLLQLGGQPGAEPRCRSSPGCLPAAQCSPAGWLGMPWPASLPLPAGAVLTRPTRCSLPSLQFPEKAIPKFILRAQRGQDLPIHGDGLAVRSYLYVEDVADAYITVLHKGQVGVVGRDRAVGGLVDGALSALLHSWKSRQLVGAKHACEEGSWSCWQYSSLGACAT